jgi:hypothetical protein
MEPEQIEPSEPGRQDIASLLNDRKTMDRALLFSSIRQIRNREATIREIMRKYHRKPMRVIINDEPRLGLLDHVGTTYMTVKFNDTKISYNCTLEELLECNPHIGVEEDTVESS